MNSALLGAFVVTISTVLAVGGMLVVRKLVGVQKLATFHEVAGNLLSVIGTLYAVLLGFVVVDAMNHMQEMRLTVEQEANAIANIYMLSEGLDPKLHERFQNYCQDYVQLVDEKEWESMQHGEPNHKAQIIVWKLWREVTHLPCPDDSITEIKDKMLDELSALSNNRRIRLVIAMEGVAPVMWVFLITGGLFTVIFTYFFGLENLAAQTIMTVLVAITLSLNVFLVYLFGYPFSGDVAVRPDVFELDYKLFKEFHQVCEELGECKAGGE